MTHDKLTAASVYFGFFFWIWPWCCASFNSLAGIEPMLPAGGSVGLAGATRRTLNLLTKFNTHSSFSPHSRPVI